MLPKPARIVPAGLKSLRGDARTERARGRQASWTGQPLDEAGLLLLGPALSTSTDPRDLPVDPSGRVARLFDDTFVLISRRRPLSEDALAEGAPATAATTERRGAAFEMLNARGIELSSDAVAKNDGLDEVANGELGVLALDRFMPGQDVRIALVDRPELQEKSFASDADPRRLSAVGLAQDSPSPLNLTSPLFSPPDPVPALETAGATDDAQSKPVLQAATTP